VRPKNRAALHQALMGWQVLVKGTQQRCPGGAESRLSLDRSLPILRNRKRLNRSGAWPGGPVVLVCRLQGHEQRLLRAAICKSTLSKGMAVSGRFAWRWQVKVPFPFQWIGLPHCASISAGARTACNSNWWGLRPMARKNGVQPARTHLLVPPMTTW